MNDFLPISKEDMLSRGWTECDFIIVTGDAYVDHPSFGTAIISRVIEREGYRVGIISQPQNDRDYMKLGRPKYAFLVNSGNIDSMVAHYTVAKKKRSEDAYSPGGVMGLRPDRAVIVYTKKIKKLFKNIPVIIGGLEASLRRFAHYDYWDDCVRPSILIDSGADLLSFGMGEYQTIEIVNRLANGEDISTLCDIKGTCYVTDVAPVGDGVTSCASFEKVRENKLSYAKAARIQQDEQDYINGSVLVQKHGEKFLVQNMHMPPLSQEDLDRVYALPFMRTYHPSYESLGGVPGIEEVEFSLTHNRGCFGNCNFCSIAFHQGRYITCRSEESILKEAQLLTTLKNFKGYIHDVGGPTANFRFPACNKQLDKGACPNKQCLFPKPCQNMIADHRDYIKLLRKLREIPKVKKVFVRSGIRFDYVLADKNREFLRELCEHHVSGQLKVAPEHISDAVLQRMGKPEVSVYNQFVKEYKAMNQKIGKEQYLVPYLMSSHPGSTLKEAIELAEYLRDLGYMPEQVQDFYPTPSTISTCMYYTGLDPRTMEEVYVPKNPHEKAMQRALIQYRNPKNYDLVYEALKKAGREDLIGFEKHCLIRPRNIGYGKTAKPWVKGGAKPWQKDAKSEKKNAPAKKRTIRNVHKKKG